jgi:GTPase SAR1 family protein
MTTVTLSLVSHTNVGKTTLARTLLGRDIGEVRDAPHVTEFADEYLLLESPSGHRLTLWDTPGFGDSVRLARRMRQSDNPLGWLLGQVWDRWRDRAFWASQQALRHVREGSDALLYLVSASEPDAGYLASEMELLAWTDRPVIVLLNQLGVPRAAVEEEAELERWRERFAPWRHVRAVLPLDAFARCWVHEEVLLIEVQKALRPTDAALVPDGPAAEQPDPRTAAMTELRAAWSQRREAQFDAACAELATSLARLAAARELVPEPTGLGERLRDWGSRLVQPGAEDAAVLAQRRLASALEDEVRASTQRLLGLHGLAGLAQAEAAALVLARVAAQAEQHRRVPEGRAAVLGGALTGALAGLKADLATGGLTLGGGMLAGGVLGALGAAGLARGINLVRGTGQSWVAWGADALSGLTETALLRYLAVAHYGRGRGEWAESEAPPHWPGTVAAALAPRREALLQLWKGRSSRQPDHDDATRLAAALQPLVQASLRDVLAALHPRAPWASAAPDNGPK